MKKTIRKIRKWVKKLFKSKKNERRVAWPTDEEVSALPPFEELLPDGIYLIESDHGARRAFEELAGEQVVGFDTESKPTFVKKEKSKGPHVAQFATLTRAFVFMLHVPECRRVVGKLIELGSLQKVGFGLGDDLKRVREKLGAEPKSVLDLETLFAAHGYGRNVGVRIGVAVMLKRQFKKPRRISASNWGAPHLTPKQILYAANDAYAAIKTYDELRRLPAPGKKKR